MTDLRALLEATKDKDYNKAVAAEMELAKPLRRCADELLAVTEAARDVTEGSPDMNEFTVPALRAALAALDAKTGAA